MKFSFHKLYQELVVTFQHLSFHMHFFSQILIFISTEINSTDFISFNITTYFIIGMVLINQRNAFKKVRSSFSDIILKLTFLFQVLYSVVKKRKKRKHPENKCWLRMWKSWNHCALLVGIFPQPLWKTVWLVAPQKIKERIII